MELLNPEETLYRISETESRTKKELVNSKFARTKLNINTAWNDRTFKDFDNTPMQPIADKLKDWDFANPNIASILSMQNGIGKTHLATCLYKKYIHNLISDSFDLHFKIYVDDIDENTRWFNADMQYLTSKRFEFLSEKKLSLLIQESFNNKQSSQLDILERYCKLDFLIIDDCFAMKQNEFARQNIFYIIDERCEWNNKPTFITSNLSLTEIADIDTRIADRIRNSMMFQITDKIESYRKKF
jgi:DNA replication protein DnaC